MKNTSIEWTDATWNPLRGCSRVSEGCRHCYAEREANRHKGPGRSYEGLVQLVNGHPAWTGEVRFVENRLLDPLRWRGKPLFDVVSGKRAGYDRLKIFVNSMSDLFHENVPDEWIDRIFAVMALCPQHTFQILTKRPARMLEYLTNDIAPLRWADAPADWKLNATEDRMVSASMDCRDDARRDKAGYVHLDNPLPNVWLGVSVENQATADERIPLLLQTPAALRFLSCEPLLGPVDISANRIPAMWNGSLRWVIAGGESGPDARAMQPDWVRSLRDQCLPAGTAFFFKQWGAWVPTTDPKVAEARGLPLPDCMSWVGRKDSRALLDGREWRDFPQLSPQ
jgi:protein gp37